MLRLINLYLVLIFFQVSCSPVGAQEPIISLYSKCDESDVDDDKLEIPKTSYYESRSENVLLCVSASSKTSTKNYEFLIEEYDAEAEKILELLTSDIPGYGGKKAESYPLMMNFDSQGHAKLNKMTETATEDSPIELVLVLNEYAVSNVFFLNQIDVAQIEILLGEYAYSYISEKIK